MNISLLTPSQGQALHRHHHRHNPADPISNKDPITGTVSGPATSQADLSDPVNVKAAQQPAQPTAPPPSPVSNAAKNGLGTIVDKKA